MRLVLDWILDYIDHRNTHWRSIIGLIMVIISLWFIWWPMLLLVGGIALIAWDQSGSEWFSGGETSQEQ